MIRPRSRFLKAVWRWGWRAALTAGLLLVIISLDLAWTWVGHRRIVSALRDSIPATTAYMRRRANQGHPVRQRRWVPLDSIPPGLVCTLLAAENVRFFEQGTFDWSNQRDMLFRALRGDFSRGGSGIVQQLARNLFLSPDRTPRRKLREYLLAYQISHTLSKQRQLELYLNLVEWGDGIWGMAAGSERLFSRPLEQLTPSEAVLFVNVLPAPSRGLAFPLSASRRAKLSGVATILWRETILDDLAWTATLARLKRMADFVDRGMPPAAAAAAVTLEMGPERTFDSEHGHPPPPLAVGCDRERRGIT